MLLALAELHPASDLPLTKLTSKVTFFLAAYTAKRVSDLVLFSMDKNLCLVGSSCVILGQRRTDRLTGDLH